MQLRRTGERGPCPRHRCGCIECSRLDAYSRILSLPFPALPGLLEKIRLARALRVPSTRGAHVLGVSFSARCLLFTLFRLYLVYTHGTRLAFSQKTFVPPSINTKSTRPRACFIPPAAGPFESDAEDNGIRSGNSDSNASVCSFLFPLFRLPICICFSPTCHI